MIQETKVFLKTVRDIYLFLDKNYTSYLKLDALRQDMVNLNEFFQPGMVDAFEKDCVRLANVNKTGGEGKHLKFTGDFDFKILDRQKVYGTNLIVKEVYREIRQVKTKRAVHIVSLGIGDGSTASEYAQHLSLDQGDRLTGLDLHGQYLNVAQERIPGLITNQFDLNDLATGKVLPLEDRCADIVECSMVGHHVEDFGCLVSEVCRILKKEGSFFYLDLIDKTARESEMTFRVDHEYPSYHGVEFFRDHEAVKQTLNRYLAPCHYCRVGPGILFLAATHV